MKVKFDLRPAGILEKERKQNSFNLTKIIAILLIAAFFVTSIGYIVTMTIQRFRMREEIDIKADLVASLESDKVVLEKQVQDLKAREKIFSDTLRIMQDDLPSLEVLNALETNIDDYGVGLDTLKFTLGVVNNGVKASDTVEVTGTAASDKQIIDFSERLRSSGVFSNVSPPITALNESTNMISFTLRMPVLPIGQIQILQ